MMTRAKILAAQAEARRFLHAADVALARLDEEAGWRAERYDDLDRRGVDGPRPPRGTSPDDHSYGSAATGTLRRRSMDLTRSLADLRRPHPWT